MKLVVVLLLVILDSLEKTNTTELEVPVDYIVGKFAAQDYIDEDTGEVLVSANAEITLEDLAKLSLAGIKEVDTLFINDLDHGAYISDTLRIDSTTNRLEGIS